MIILLGAPGSGKGTQAELLSKKLNIPIVCMGDIIRNEIKNKTTLGKEMINYMSKGDLVPDQVINDIFKSNISNTASDFILDGYPRTINQAKYLQHLELIKEYDTTVILIDVPDEILVERLLERKRQDDTKSIIKNRLSIYKKEIEPMISFYEDILIKINGNSNIDIINTKIMSYCFNSKIKT